MFLYLSSLYCFNFVRFDSWHTVNLRMLILKLSTKTRSGLEDCWKTLSTEIHCPG